MKNWNTTEILALLKQSGEIAMSYYEKPGARLKSDLSLVTEADHAIEHTFEEHFDRPEEGSYLIGEETIDRKDDSYGGKALEETAWIIDPIDGTAPYAHHVPTWGISVARAEAGRITDGAIYLPVTREVFITSGADILTGIHPDGDFDSLSLEPLKTVRREPDTGGMIAVTQSVVKRGSFDLPNPVMALVCAVLPLTYLLSGRFLAYNGTIKLWDIAGALPMLERAGFVSMLVDGTQVGTEISPEVFYLGKDAPLRWSMRKPVICGPTQSVVDYFKNGMFFD